MDEQNAPEEVFIWPMPFEVEGATEWAGGWSDKREEDHDVCYIRADIAEKQIAELEKHYEKELARESKAYLSNLANRDQAVKALKKRIAELEAECEANKELYKYSENDMKLLSALLNGSRKANSILNQRIAELKKRIRDLEIALADSNDTHAD